MSPLIVQGRADQLQVLWLQPRSHLQFQQLLLILQHNHGKSVVQTLPPHEEEENNKNKQKEKEKGKTGKVAWIRDAAWSDDRFDSQNTSSIGTIIPCYTKP